ncbi:uncharacterized protein METZ01_LOCUS433597, partial [marine metagenome]
HPGTQICVRHLCTRNRIEERLLSKIL